MKEKKIYMIVLIVCIVLIVAFLIISSKLKWDTSEKMENEVAGYVVVDSFDSDRYKDRESPIIVVEKSTSGNEIPEAATREN